VERDRATENTNRSSHFLARLPAGTGEGREQVNYIVPTLDTPASYEFASGTSHQSVNPYIPDQGQRNNIHFHYFVVTNSQVPCFTKVHLALETLYQLKKLIAKCKTRSTVSYELSCCKHGIEQDDCKTSTHCIRVARCIRN
jgi:hypothetical protein